MSGRIHLKQPNLLASCVVQARLGSDEHSVELLLNLLLACYLAMNESGYEWPLVTEDDQQQQLARMVGAVQFWEDLKDPAAADAARAQYVASHTEQPLLALVVSQCTEWLRDLGHSKTEKKSDKLVMLAAINLVNCIAHASAKPGRA